MNTTRLIKAAAGGLALCVLMSACGFYAEWQGIRDSVVRLHILAHSDTTADQVLKLQVRDTVADTTAAMMEDVEDAPSALATVQANLPAIEAAAQQTVYAAGYDYPVRAEVCEMYFATRQYEHATLPAGMYDAVRVTIGDGKGQNWWCVMFPPMCAGAATDQTFADVLDDSQQSVVSDGERYIIRFKIIEWIESFFQLFRS